MLNITGIHVHKFPSGKWGFVGRVPHQLAFRCNAEDFECARKHGAGLARRIAHNAGRTFETIVFDTEEQAKQALAAYHASQPEQVA